MNTPGISLWADIFVIFAAIVDKDDSTSRKTPGMIYANFRGATIFPYIIVLTCDQQCELFLVISEVAIEGADGSRRPSTR